MSRRKKVLLWVLSAILSLPLLEIALILIADMPLATYEFPLEDGQNLTSEQIAVRYSRRALVKYGIDVYKIMPIARKKWGNVFFSTGTNDPDRGRVYWDDLDKPRRYNYIVTVTIERDAHVSRQGIPVFAPVPVPMPVPDSVGGSCLATGREMTCTSGTIDRQRSRVECKIFRPH
ncbi:MAG: hypothetical protein HYV63_26025 [Candidatus Schekmanbacteria bacterium]|nr:hypothetical protein [Candidatus Schekmanbacteria bacterium]